MVNMDRALELENQYFASITVKTDQARIIHRCSSVDFKVRRKT